MATEEVKFQPKDYKSDQYAGVRVVETMPC